MKNKGRGGGAPDAAPSPPIPRCVVALPPRDGGSTAVTERWELSLPGGVDFEGLHFSFPGGCSVSAEARWLEASLLSVTVSLSGEALVPCARCLKQTSLAISDVLVYLYYSRGLEFGKDTELESDEGFMPVEVEGFGRTLDLAPQIWETLLLLLPLKPLCREDCAGLCPNCGADLNEGPCSCGGDAGDPRFEALRRWTPPAS